MSETNGNEFAYPIFDDAGLCHDNETGLTKREYFASMAMQGIAANPNLKKDGSPEWVSEWSVKYADELVKALNK